VIPVLALGTFLMGTTEFMAAGLLPELARGLHVSVARVGMSITVFSLGMIVGAPLMSLLTLPVPKRLTLIVALGMFAGGHVLAAVASSLRGPGAGPGLRAHRGRLQLRDRRRVLDRRPRAGFPPQHLGPAAVGTATAARRSPTPVNTSEGEPPNAWSDHAHRPRRPG
jgi:MFS family permease